MSYARFTITYWHGKQPFKLSEYELLPCFRRYGLKEYLRGQSRIQVLQETVYAGFTDARELILPISEEGCE